MFIQSKFVTRITNSKRCTGRQTFFFLDFWNERFQAPNVLLKFRSQHLLYDFSSSSNKSLKLFHKVKIDSAITVCGSFTAGTDDVYRCSTETCNGTSISHCELPPISSRTSYCMDWCMWMCRALHPALCAYSVETGHKTHMCSGRGTYVPTGSREARTYEPPTYDWNCLVEAGEWWTRDYCGIITAAHSTYRASV